MNDPLGKGCMAMVIRPLGKNKEMLGAVVEIIDVDPAMLFPSGAVRPACCIRVHRPIETIATSPVQGADTTGWVPRISLKPMPKLPPSETFVTEQAPVHYNCRSVLRPITS